MLHEVEGDLLEAPQKYIVHQTNCLSNGGAAGIARVLFDKFPWSDVYSCRKKSGLESSLDYEDEPGTIIIRGDGVSERFVVGLMGQYYPGGVRYPNSAKDGYKARQKYFYKGLWEIAQIPDLESVAFPYQIGCGIAGGDWDIFHRIINNLAEYLDGKADVYIYRLPNA